MKTALRNILLVEDQAPQSQLIECMLNQLSPNQYNVFKATDVDDALAKLDGKQISIVVVDLLEQNDGLAEIVARVHISAVGIPILVLTPHNDEQLGLACIHAGAQDYLPKEELRPQTLRRAIGYAITRQREAQIRDLQQTLDHLRQLSSANARTQTTAKLTLNGAVCERHSNEFSQIVDDYSSLLGVYLDHLVVFKDKPRDQMELLITRLGDLGGGPRDLMDVHVAALDASVAKQNAERGRALAVEGRLLALEMMGLLVDYYRIGQRRRFL